jgi:competence transcription factor ComK
MDKSFEVETYVISEMTYALQTKLVDNKYYTTIVDKRGTVDCPKSVTRVISTSCRNSGISLERTKALARRHFKEGVHKLPLILSYKGTTPLVFFPIYSSRSPGNVWVNTNAISNIQSAHHETLVTLVNGEELVLPVQFTAFCGLYVRALFYQRFLSKQAKNRNFLLLT